MGFSSRRIILVAFLLLTFASQGTCRQCGRLQPPPLVTFLKPRGGAVVKSDLYATHNPLTRKVYKYTDALFDKFDENSDGVLSFNEVYEIMLLVSIQVNRQAPIPPPTKKVAKLLFEMSDVDKSGKLSKEELKKIVLLAMPRTTARLAAHKILSFLVAPMLAVKTVNRLDGNVWLMELGEKWVPENFKHIVLTKDFWKLTLTVSLVSALGSSVIKGITWAYDFLFKLKPDKQDKE